MRPTATILLTTLALGLLTSAARATPPLIRTIAGERCGDAGWGGTFSLITATALDGVKGLAALPGEEYLLVANDRVYRVRRTGRYDTVAGTGVRDASGDGFGGALNDVHDVAVAPDGTIYASENGHVYLGGARIRRIAPNGYTTTLAVADYATGLGIARNGDVLAALPRTGRVLRITPTGASRTIAGTGGQEDTGDGGLATAAGILAPQDVAEAPDGSIYIASFQRVRRVAPDGTISTVAGTGSWKSDDDAGLGTSIGIQPSQIAAAPDGSMVFTETTRVRRLTPDGYLDTLAGAAAEWSSSIEQHEEGLASLARFRQAFGITVTADGAVLVGEFHGCQVRRIDAALVPPPAAAALAAPSSGAPGPAGTAGATGATGPQGPPGAAEATPLRLTPTRTRWVATVGRPLRLRIALSAAADVTVTVTGAGRPAYEAARTLRAGRQDLVVAGRAWPAPGRYRVALRAVDDEARTAVASVTVQVPRGATRSRAAR